MIRSNNYARNALAKIQFSINSTIAVAYSTPAIHYHLDKGKGRAVEPESISKENQRIDRREVKSNAVRVRNAVASSSAITLDKIGSPVENKLTQQPIQSTGPPPSSNQPHSLPPIQQEKKKRRKPTANVQAQLLPLSPPSSTPPLANLSDAELRDHIINLSPTTSFQFIQSYRKLLLQKSLLSELDLVQKVVIGFIDLNEFSCALRFLKETLKVLKKDSTFNTLEFTILFEDAIRSLVKYDKQEWIILFTQLAITTAILSPSVLFSRIKSLILQSRHQEVLKTYDLFLQCRFEPIGELYDQLVLSLLLSGDLLSAQRTLKEKAERGFGTDRITCLALLEGMRRFGGNVELEEKILRDKSGFGEGGKFLREDVIILNRIMSIRIERGDFESVGAILDYFNLEGLPFDLALPLTKNLSYEMEVGEGGVKPIPDLATFTILIGLSRKMRRLDCALTLFKQSQQIHLGLNEYLLGAIINALCSGGEVLAAKAFFIALGEGKARLPGRPLDKIARFKATNAVFDPLWRGILRVEGIEGANRIISLLLSSSTYSDIIITDSIVTSLLYHLTHTSKRSTSAAVTKICTGMIMRISYLTKGGRKPTITDLNLLLENAWQQERFKTKAGNNYLDRRMEKRPVSLGSISTTYSNVPPIPPTEPVNPPPLPTALAKIQASLSSRALSNDSITTKLLLRNTNAFESISSRWNFIQTEVINKGFQPTSLHIAYLIRAYLVEGDVTGARECILRAREMGVKDSIAWYGILIGGCNRLGKFQEAKEIFRELIGSGLQLDKRLFFTLAVDFARRGNLEGVRKVRDQILEFLGEDVRNDLVFIGIQYRTFIARGDLLRAQNSISTFLEKEEGKMDKGLLKILETTGKWIRNKLNRSNRGLSSKFTKKELENLYKIWSGNFNKARKIFRKNEKVLEAGAVEKLDRFWVKASRRGTTGNTIRVRGVSKKKKRKVNVVIVA